MKHSFMGNKYTFRPIPPKIELEQLYHAEGLSQAEVAEKYNASQKMVYSWFKKLGIKSRIPFKRNQNRENNSSWKGDKATYAAFHYRVESARGKPMICTVCGAINKSVYEWANLSGRYEDVNDYARMCRKCHRAYDKNRKNSSKHVKRTCK